MEYFITGTDTDIGKTFITKGLALYFESIGKNIGVFKPLQSSAIKTENGFIAPDLYEIEKLSKNIKTKCSYLLEGDVSPALAARLSGINLDINKIKKDFNNFKNENEITLVEGAVKKALAEAEEKAREANMSELEKAQKALEKANKATEDYRIKYELEAEKTALTAQREQALKDMAELGVDAGCLDYVFIPKDTDGTKARAKAFKEYIDNVKKTTFESNVKSTIPVAGGATTGSNADINNAIRAAAGL